MQAIHVADFFFPHCSALSPAPLYVSSALAKHSFSMLCPCRTLPCYALRCLRPAMQCPSLLCLCVAVRRPAMLCPCCASLCQAYLCYALALRRKSLHFGVWPCLCCPLLSFALPSLCYACPCAAMQCPCCALSRQADLCNAFALRRRSLRFGVWPCPRITIRCFAMLCKGKFSSLRFGNRYISPSIRLFSTLLRKVGFAAAVYLRRAYRHPTCRSDVRSS